MASHRLNTVLSDLWRFRAFLKYETAAKLKVRHKRTYLGYIWWLLEPLLFLGVYFFLIQVVFKRGGDNYLAFLFCALLPWRWFSSTILECSTSLMGKAALIKQVYFPKLVVPMSVVLTHLANFGFGLIILALLLAFHRVPVGYNLLFFPLVVVTQLAFGLGVGLILADINVYLKDIGELLRGGLLQLWFFASPGLYPVERVPESIRFYYQLNPFAVFMTSYRDTLMYNRTPDLLRLGIILVGSLFLIYVGMRLIVKHQGHYAKIL